MSVEPTRTRPSLPAGRLPRALTVAVLWLAVVALGSGLVWTVISAAGEDFTRQSGALPAAPGVGGGVAPATTDGGTPATSPTPDGVAPGGVAPGTPAASAPAAPRTPSARPSARPASPAPRRPRASTSGSGRAPAPVETRSRTWSGAAGTVTTRCTGAVIKLVSASASADGYRVEVKDRGPEKVEVEFEGTSDDSVADTKVEARCSGGTPAYRVDVDG